MNDAEREIGLTLRLLLGVIGLMAIAAAYVVGSAQLRATGASSRLPALLLAGFCLVIVLGGLQLIRGAVRGRIRFRRIRRTR